MTFLLQLQRFSSQQAICFKVLFLRPPNYILRQSRSRSLLVPVNALQVVANELLVKRGLRSTRLVALTRPETRRVRSEHLISQHDSAGRLSELKLGVSEN